MNKDRLMLAVQALEEAEHPERFSMRFYLHLDRDMMTSFYKQVEGYEPSWCGTPACILGHLGSRQDLQQFFYAEDCSLKYTPKDPDGYAYTVAWGDVDLQRWFDLDHYYMRMLFSEDGCDGAKTTKEAADYIKNFIEKYENVDTSPDCDKESDCEPAYSVTAD
jgi:hypothetical protein